MITITATNRFISAVLLLSATCSAAQDDGRTRTWSKEVRSWPEQNPEESRGTLWKVELLHSKTITDQQLEQYEAYKHKYLDMRKAVLEDSYHDMHKCFNQIKADTFDRAAFPSASTEESRESLQNIFGAYSLYDPELGYSQGMDTAAALLLMQDMSEAEVFWCYAELMNGKKYGLRTLFDLRHEVPRETKKCHGFPCRKDTPGHIFPGCTSLWKDLGAKDPQLLQHMEKQLGEFGAQFSETWFRTFYTHPKFEHQQKQLFELSEVKRIFENVILNGSSYLYHPAMVLILSNRDEIMNSDNILLPLQMRPKRPVGNIEYYLNADHPNGYCRSMRNCHLKYPSAKVIAPNYWVFHNIRVSTVGRKSSTIERDVELYCVGGEPQLRFPDHNGQQKERVLTSVVKTNKKWIQLSFRNSKTKNIKFKIKDSDDNNPAAIELLEAIYREFKNLVGRDKIKARLNLASGSESDITDTASDMSLRRRLSSRRS